MSSITLLTSDSTAGSGLLSAVARLFGLRNGAEEKPAAVSSLPSVTRKAGRLISTTEYRCSNKAKTRSAPRPLEKSVTMNPNKAGFLDLPAELRNEIYTDLLVVDGTVRLTATNPSKITKVPGLVLLRVCKQVRGEAASVFFARNSFFIQFERALQVVDKGEMMGEDIKHLHFPDSPPDETCERSCVGRVFFPAPDHHIFMSRMTIQVEVSLRWGQPQTKGPAHKVPDTCHRDVGKSVSELHRRFFESYEKMRLLWEEKESEWEGRMYSQVHDFHGGHILNYTISFHEAEEEEVAKRRVWAVRSGSTETASSRDRGLDDDTGEAEMS